MIDKAVTLLPHPDSPTRPSVSPARILKSTPFDRFNHPMIGIEIGMQVLDVEQNIIHGDLWLS